MVQFIIDKGEAKTVVEALEMGNQLIFFDLLHHVTDQHSFKNEYLFYRFRDVEAQFLKDNEASFTQDNLINQQLEDLYQRIINVKKSNFYFFFEKISQKENLKNQKKKKNLLGKMYNFSSQNSRNFILPIKNIYFFKKKKIQINQQKNKIEGNISNMLSK